MSLVLCLSVASAAGVAVFLDEPSSSAAHPPSTWAAPGPLVRDNLQVTLCPTHLGASASHATSLPTHLRAIVSRRLVGTLTTFTDARGTLDVVAPSTWQCTALDGVAGLSTLIVYPPGQPRPPWGDVAVVHQGIAASQSGGCGGCSLETACSLFTPAQHRYLATYGIACQHADEHEELVTHVSSAQTKFIDPPGVFGAGRPSGGVDAAYGAMVWRPRHGVRFPRASLITCTLPDADHELCVLTVDAFLGRYRN